MDLVAGEAPTILMVIGLDDLAALDDRSPLHRPPRARERARPDLARPLRRGGPDGDRWRRAASTSSTRGSSSTDPGDGDEPHHRAGRPDLDHDGRAGPTDHDARRHRRALDRARRGRDRRAAARGEALDPRPRRPRSSPSAARRTGRPDVSSPGRLRVTDADAGRRGVVRGQPVALGRLDGHPRRGRVLRPRGLQGRRRPAPAVRDRDDRRRHRQDRSCTSSATSGSTRCRGRGSGRASPAPTCRPRRSSWRARWPTSSASPRRASSSRTCTTCRTCLDGRFDVVYTSRGVLGWLPDIRGVGAGRRPFPGAGRDVLHHRGPPGHEGLRERGRRARRAAPRLPVLGARRAADLRGQGLVRRPGRRGPRPDRALAGITGSARSSPR